MPQAVASVSKDEELQRFYEAYPYPRQDEDLRPLLVGESVLVGNPKHWFHMYFPAEAYRAEIDVLIAGCGTREAARIAAGNRDCRVTAIDISTRSLEATCELKSEYGLDNLSLRQLPLERAAELDREFDLIFCSGVLHHTANPAVGLRSLRQVLKRSGALNAMLYGRYGRLAIEQMQELLLAAGVTAENGGPERVRQWLKALPTEHPFRAEMNSLADLEYDEGIADLLLNPRETSYSVGEVSALLEDNGFALHRFVCQAHYEPVCSLLATDEELLERSRPLPDVERWGLMELHRGNMRRHVFVAGRDDRPRPSWSVDFSGDAWLDYVPVRNPGIEAASDGLPEGARTRLFWPNHEYLEISAVLDDVQTTLFLQVDHRRTVREILSDAFGQSGDAALSEGAVTFAREFFQSMWRFDYVWFQTAGGGEPAWEPTR